MRVSYPDGMYAPNTAYVPSARCWNLQVGGADTVPLMRRLGTLALTLSLIFAYV